MEGMSMSASPMAPKQAAVALVAAMPIGGSFQQTGGIWDRSDDKAGSGDHARSAFLNLLWIFAAIETHIAQKYQPALSELILDAMEAGWGTNIPLGPAGRTAYLNE